MSSSSRQRQQHQGGAGSPKTFVLRKLQDRNVEPLFVARLTKVWDSTKGRAATVDLAGYDGLEMFCEDAPVALEEDEKGLETIRVREELKLLYAN